MMTSAKARTHSLLQSKSLQGLAPPAASLSSGELCAAPPLLTAVAEAMAWTLDTCCCCPD